MHNVALRYIKRFNIVECRFLVYNWTSITVFARLSLQKLRKNPGSEHSDSWLSAWLKCTESDSLHSDSWLSAWLKCTESDSEHSESWLSAWLKCIESDSEHSDSWLSAWLKCTESDSERCSVFISWVSNGWSWKMSYVLIKYLSKMYLKCKTA